MHGIGQDPPRDVRFEVGLERLKNSVRFLTRNRRRFTSLCQKFGGESLRLGNALYFNGDGIDRLLQLIESILKRYRGGQVAWRGLFLNSAHQPDGDRGQCTNHHYDDRGNDCKVCYIRIHLVLINGFLNTYGADSRWFPSGASS